MLEIVPYNLHWLGDSPAQSDLCAHGGLRVSDGTQTLASTSDDDMALSTAALHLLRAMSLDHTPEAPVAEHLIPHCGHFMVIDGAERQLVNLGCNVGLNWWVRHRGASVELEFDGGRRHVVTNREWRQAVCALSDAVARFFDESPPKVPEDDNDREWYAAFQAEWRTLRGSHDAA